MKYLFYKIILKVLSTKRYFYPSLNEKELAELRLKKKIIPTKDGLLQFINQRPIGGFNQLYFLPSIAIKLLCYMAERTGLKVEVSAPPPTERLIDVIGTKPCCCHDTEPSAS
jgi:hypothetical protein